MMQFKINGEELEMNDGLSLSFKKTNSLLAFDDIACERSDSFKIPATPKNIALLNMSQDIHWVGSFMRTKTAAQLVDGTIVQDGELYVDSFENGEFNAIFLCGENLVLKRLKEKGKLGDFLTKQTCPDSQVWSMDYDTELDSDAMAMAVYYNNAIESGGVVLHSTLNPRPCVKFQNLLEYAAPFAGLGNIREWVFPLVGDIYREDGSIAKPGDTIYLYKNLPEWTAIDMMKIAAAISGKLIKVSNGEVEFYSPIVETMPHIDITDRILRYGKMERKVAKYGQHNYVQFDNVKDLKKAFGSPDPNILEFTIDNENIEEEKVLYTMPLLVRTPELGAAQGYCITTLKSVSLNNDAQPKMEFKFWDDAYPLGVLSKLTSGTFAGYYGIRDIYHSQDEGIDFIDRICNQSTMLDVDVRMTRLEFDDIKPDTVFYLNGAEWSWNTATWSGEAAKISLCKL